MRLENQVCSLELSKKLKELGVKQESEFWWCEHQDTFYIEHKSKHCNQSIGGISAFTVAELGEMLPRDYGSWKRNEWRCANMLDFTEDKLAETIWDDTEANARAKMVIYLKESW